MDRISTGEENREIKSLGSFQLRTTTFDQLNLWGRRRGGNGCEMGNSRRKRREEETDD